MKNLSRRAMGAFGGLLSLLMFLMFNPPAQAQDQTDASGAVSTDGGGGSLSEITYGGKVGLTSSGFYRGFAEGRPHTRERDRPDGRWLRQLLRTGLPRRIG